MSDQNNKPVLDEQTFARLLEAAYVLQEHNRQVKELGESLESHSEELRQRDRLLENAREKSRKFAEQSAPNGDYTLTLAEIVEAQHQIQMRHLDLDHALAVVAERVMRIAGASGAGIGLLDGATVRYRAAAGAPALPVGSEVALQSAVCQANVRTGQVIRTDDVDTEFLFDPEPCRARGILSLLAVPIYHDGNIVGALELYFDRLQGYAEQDVHTCQLMAGLVTEALGRDSESKLKKSMAEERSSMLAAIERLQPNLSALAREQSPPAAPIAPGTTQAQKVTCWKCAQPLLAEEQFCGNCGAPRSSAAEPATMQSKLASAWQKQQGEAQADHAFSAGETPAFPPAFAAEGSDGDSAGEETAHEEIAHPAAEEFAAPRSLWSRKKIDGKPRADSQASDREDEAEAGRVVPISTTTLATTEPDPAVWSSASKTRDFFESLSGGREPGALAQFWRARRGDIYLVVALILVVVVIRWGIWSNHPVGAQAHGSPAPSAAHAPASSENNLSTFDKVLIAFGLADPPETPENRGNPDVQVWVDLQTAQYYCPGSDLYGKTPKGKMTSQRGAQLDQFQPAYGKTCE
ncbi:MAG TPA: GAF domain-containing protein [Candidatus Binatia bacterium]|nr:GAF domain-containing protein [Candidatus Binatia bacterium]